jgi:CRISPR-associated endonuclease/helicase Cas3
LNLNSFNYLAHSENNLGETDFLHRHLETVAKRAASFADASGLTNEAYLAGLLHDLGKYGDLFQRRLEGKEKGIDHWSAGACAALEIYQAKGLAPALAIQGHHIGLQSAEPDSIRSINMKQLASMHPLGLRLSESDISKLILRFENDALTLPPIEAQKYSWTFSLPLAKMLDIRILYSALVDADFIETESHMQASIKGLSCRPEGLQLSPELALEKLELYLKELTMNSTAAPAVNELRADLLKSCLDKAPQPHGLFTLTAPTGAGKTLAMLAFALKHAVHNRLRRVVFVIPYLNIIEQTVRQYNKVFTLFSEEISRYILDDDSLAGVRDTESSSSDYERNYARDLLAQNWDAPIIVTTSVQFLESLFANRPAACRKLHRLARSVILFDEVQTLPTSLAIPTLGALSHLANHYQSTVVFSTATQPAFQNLDANVRKQCGSGWSPVKIAKTNLYSKIKRTEIEWPDLNTVTPWQDIASQINNHSQALCIVNLKKHAVALFQELRKDGDNDLYYLSTNMCAAHRLKVLDEVRTRLINQQPCRLVSTQCVEAGVDIDFPTVYRALGPLDSIAQAAGRCNRQGLSSTPGKVHVFVPEDEGYPDGAYRQATGITRIMLTELGANRMDINNPELYEQYYKRLYLLSDLEKAKPELKDALNRQDFAQVARYYRIINTDTINILVPFERKVFDDLKEEINNDRLTRQWVMRARPHAVGIFRPRPSDPVQPFLEPVAVNGITKSDDWFIYLKEEHYDMKLGLVLPKTSNCLIA